MRVKFAIAEMMFSIFVNIIVLFLHQKSTRAYIRNVKTSLMSTSQCFSQRSLNKRRRLTSIITQFIDDRERSEKNDQTDESIDSRAEVVAVLSLFLSQEEESSRSEQHDNYDDFDSDIEIERLVSEFPNVVPITERAKISESQPSKIDKNRIPTSRPRVVKKSLSLF